jgi:LysM repeat protein
MKKVLVFLFVAMAFIGLSCKSGPTVSGVIIEGEATPEKIEKALEDIYDAFFAKLDLSDAQIYTVVSGDVLNQITRRFYGDLTDVGNAGSRNGFYFPIIMLASSNAGIVDPDKIEPGMKLTIPNLQKNLANSGSRKAIKDCLNDIAYVYNRRGDSANEKGLVDLANSL